ncbi:MAG: adenylyltransferase/cytidyltransferase family protein [Clostridia bacterium]
MQKSTKRVIITSGYFNPLHIGHINLMSEARKLGDFLVVIVNNDEQVKIKGSVPFMKQDERVEIIKTLKFVDQVFLSVDKDGTVTESLKAIAGLYKGELLFAKGGDRNTGNIPENERLICDKFNIKIIDDVGGGKVQSSSWLISKAKNNKR